MLMDSSETALSKYMDQQKFLLYIPSIGLHYQLYVCSIQPISFIYLQTVHFVFSFDILCVNRVKNIFSLHILHILSKETLLELWGARQSRVLKRILRQIPLYMKVIQRAPRAKGGEIVSIFPYLDTCMYISSTQIQTCWLSISLMSQCNSLVSVLQVPLCGGSAEEMPFLYSHSFYSTIREPWLFNSSGSNSVGPSSIPSV